MENCQRLTDLSKSMMEQKTATLVNLKKEQKSELIGCQVRLDNLIIVQNTKTTIKLLIKKRKKELISLKASSAEAKKLVNHLLG